MNSTLFLTSVFWASNLLAINRPGFPNGTVKGMFFVNDTSFILVVRNRLIPSTAGSDERARQMQNASTSFGITAMSRPEAHQRRRFLNVRR